MFSQTFVVVTCCLFAFVLSETYNRRYHSINEILANYDFERLFNKFEEVTTTVEPYTTTETESYTNIITQNYHSDSTNEGSESTTTSSENYFDYCQICDVPGTHTVCKFPRCEVSGNCTLVKQIPLNSKEKQLIVNYHNELRNKVARGLVKNQPSATNMQELEWDEELEYISQCWANQCKFEHDECRNTQKGYSGQNIVYHGSTLQSQTQQESLKGLIDDWFNEYVDLPNEYIKSRPWNNPTFTNHYTQLVWAETNRIGCARVYAFENPFYTVYLYCNYGPGGNDINKPIYITGLPATDCQKYGLKKSVNYSGLCN